MKAKDVLGAVGGAQRGQWFGTGSIVIFMAMLFG